MKKTDMSSSAPDPKRLDEALARLLLPQNEPVNWLLGDFLRERAMAPGPPHFLLLRLNSKNPKALEAWNSLISISRQHLQNPEAFKAKVADDLSLGKKEKGEKSNPETKAMAVISEVIALIHLAGEGYYAFEAVPPAKIAMPDFFARLNGKKARIEVKHLNEPDDWITQIARNRWRLSSNARPEKYGFRTQLRHNHRGPVSEKAINRIKSIIDQLPDMNSPHEETLDGDIYVKLEKLPLQPGQTLGDLFVTIGITAENVMIDSANVVFLKALRVIAKATPKFFSPKTSQDYYNVIALRWDPPDSFVDAGTPNRIGTAIEQLFASFGLQLKIFIFWRDPQIPKL